MLIPLVFQDSSSIPRQSILAVQTVGISNAIRTDNNLVHVYQLSKAKFGLTPFNSAQKSVTTLGVRSFPGVPASPSVPG